MHDLADLLAAVGTSGRSFWLPMLVWTALALALHALLRRRASVPPQVHYQLRLALLAALPLGLAAAWALDVSFASFWPAPAAEPAAAVPLDAAALLWVSPVPTAPLPAAALTWSLLHLLGLLTLLAGLAALGRLCVLGWQAAALYRFRAGVTALPDAALQTEIDELAAQVGLGRRVRGFVSPAITVPMTFGWWAPLIVLPAPLRQDDPARRMTVLHELFHIRRHDFVLHAAEQVGAALFVVNPVVRVLLQAVEGYREILCDAEVLTQPGTSRKRYAALLLRFITPEPPPRLMALRVVPAKKHIKQRIQAMTAKPHHPFLTPRGFALAMGLFVLGGAAALVAFSDVFGPSAPLMEAAAPAHEALTDEAVMALHEESFVVVEEMPRLIGGLGALQQEIRYPALAEKAGIEGRVLVEFVVDANGHVVAPRVVQGIGAGCDEEAMRAVSLARFEPGQQRGRAVKVKMTIPIVFRLAGTNQSTLVRRSAPAPKPQQAERLFQDQFGLSLEFLKRSESQLGGRVVAAGTQDPVAGVLVMAIGEGLMPTGNHTDADGRFDIEVETSRVASLHFYHEGNQVEIPLVAPEEAFVVVEEMPELIGGLGALQQQIRYPALAQKAGIEGRVFVQFIVDEDGRVVEADVVRGIGAGCDEEALRVVRAARFKPGLQRGQAVRVKMSLPITFRLPGDAAEATQAQGTLRRSQ